MTVSVCIATFRRQENLRVLLADLAAQKYPIHEVIVVDNDATASARWVIEERCVLGFPCALRYDVQPKKNISLTRNRTVELASGDWVAVLDDDERVLPPWLKLHMDTIELHAADGALGPVIPVVPRDAPKWIQRGHFYDWQRLKTGRVVPRNCLRFGNVVLRAELFRRFPMPFDPAYGLTGGEDGDFLTRLVLSGARIVWCDEAIAQEPIVPSRLSFGWLVKRSLRGGQDFCRHFLAGRYGKSGAPPAAFARAKFATQAAVQGVLALALAAVFALIGRHITVFWILKAAANFGKLSAFHGWHYREYAHGERVETRASTSEVHP
jgi:succinoglycan biosynthesis protein ExoM